jgi:type II restriction enzyme
LAILASFSQITTKAKTENLLHKILKTVSALNPSKDALAYWLAINKSMLEYSSVIETLWETEKLVALESVLVAKEEALTFLAQERERIMRMSHEEALSELVRIHNIENRIKIINSVKNNEILEIR